MEKLLTYFPTLTDLQQQQLQQLQGLYADWNRKINVISRKDIDALYERHVLHALGIAKVISFRPNANILESFLVTIGPMSRLVRLVAPYFIGLNFLEDIENDPSLKGVKLR